MECLVSHFVCAAFVSDGFVTMSTIRPPDGSARAKNAPRQADQKKVRLSPRAAELLADRQGQLPVWIRAPKSGTEFYSGFSRSKLYEGANKGYIRSVSIREPGQVKGTRLFHLASILDWVERCEATAGSANSTRMSGSSRGRIAMNFKNDRNWVERKLKPGTIEANQKGGLK
jgi:hypothetical protein